ncbi:MAG: bifunctional hydroxymethylpyrimidine kinase/phosphomethylpyrimidine kinase [Alphaproteobacteria bacterium]|nr:bifunctional hydroxymethylpyrimidine kinase/phosphomethylpyrimidine kinase [Alphaproteobacteria bacterium]
MRALVIGNLALDERLYVDALPRPGETLLAARAESDLGGKGANQAVVLARAGVATRLLSCIGADAAGAGLRTLLAAEPLQTTLLPSETPTDRSIVLVAADGENAIVSTAACARGLCAADVDAALDDADLALLQGNLSPALTGHALTAARVRERRTVFNPAPADPEFVALCAHADLLVCNRIEAEALTGAAAPEAAARRLHAAGAARVAITLGAAGVLFRDAAGHLAVSATPATVRDTTGAGDTFVAALTAALFAYDMPPRAALEAAGRAAAITVARPGTLAAFPTAAELAAIFAR